MSTTQEHTFPTLYTLSSTGAKRYWKAKAILESDGQAYTVRNYGQVGGKDVEIKKVVPVTKSKSTVFEQAIFDAESLWTDQKEKKGYVEDINALSSTKSQLTGAAVKSSAQPKLQIKLKSDGGNGKLKIPLKVNQKTTTSSVDDSKYEKYASFKFLPMLANKFVEKKHNIKYPARGQRKLDGVRCTVRRVPGNKFMLRSRNDKEYPYFHEIRDALEKLDLPPAVFLDGELYSTHKDVPFKTLNGYCNRRKIGSKTGYDKIPKEHLESIHYYIFDCYFPDEPDMGFDDRFDYLERLLTNSQSKYLKLVRCEDIKSEEDVKPMHDKYVNEEGFEGVMIRNTAGPYKLKNRSNDLLKYKEFEDSEYRIAGAIHGTGKEAGCIIWILRLTGDSSDDPDIVLDQDDPDFDLTAYNKYIEDKFTCRPRGSYEEREQDWADYVCNPEKYIDQMYTVRYQEKYDNGKPRFPAGIAIRWDL
jgi:ATP-dependent DNA ligase